MLAGVLLSAPLALHGHVPTLTASPVGAAEAVRWPTNVGGPWFLPSAMQAVLPANVQPGSAPVAAITNAFSTITAAGGPAFAAGGYLLQTSVSTIGMDGTSLITFENTPTNAAATYGLTAASFTLWVNNFLQNGIHPILECDVAFNPALNFSTLGTTGYYDIRGLITHEIGHMIGLGHSPILHATMYASALSVERTADLATLSTDDIAGIHALYGTPPNQVLDGVITATIVTGAAAPVNAANVVLQDIVTGRVITGGVSLAGGNVFIGGVPRGVYNMLVLPLTDSATISSLTGPYWQTVVPTTAFKPLLVGGWATPTPIAVHPGQITAVGNVTVVAGTSNTSLRYIGISASPTSASNTYRGVAVPAGWQGYIVVIGTRVDQILDSDFGFDSSFVLLAGGATATGPAGPGQGYKFFPVYVAPNAPAGGYALRVRDSATLEMAVMAGGLEITSPPGPAASAVRYGTGCGGGHTAPVLAASSDPSIGNLAFSLDVFGAPPGSPVTFVLAFGPDALVAPGGCIAWIDLGDLFVPINTFTVNAGAQLASLPIPIPNNPVFAGYQVYAQCLAITGLSNIGYMTSNGVALSVY